MNSDMSMSSITGGECFMELGVGYVKSSKSNEFIPLRFLFDTASNGSYGKISSFQNLEFSKIGERNLEINTFSSGGVKCN